MGDDNPDGWMVDDQFFFRDGLWVTTWWAGMVGSIDDVSQSIYTTLWP